MKYEDVKIGLLVEDDKGRKGTVTKKLKTRATVLFQKVVNGMVVDYSAILYPGDFARIFPVNPGKVIPKSLKYVPHLPTLSNANTTTQEARAYKSMEDMLDALKITIKPKTVRQEYNAPISGSFDYWGNLTSVILVKHVKDVTREERRAVKATVYHLMFGPDKKAIKKDIKEFVKSIQQNE